MRNEHRRRALFSVSAAAIDGTAQVTVTLVGAQYRVTCADDSEVNFTASAFAESECARYLPIYSKCAGHK